MLSVIKNNDFLYCFYLFQIFDREYNFHIYIHSFTQFIIITHFHYPYFTLKTYLWVCNIKCSFLFLVNTIDFSWFQIFLDVYFTFMGFYLHYNAIDEERFLWHLRMKLAIKRQHTELNITFLISQNVIDVKPCLFLVNRYYFVILFCLSRAIWDSGSKKY